MIAYEAVVFVLFTLVVFVALGLGAFLVWLAVYAIGWAVFGARDRGRHRGRRRWRGAPHADPHPDVPVPSGLEVPARPDGPPPGHGWLAPAPDPHADTQPIPQAQEAAA